MLHNCHTTLQQRTVLISLLSGWATTVGRLLRPKVVVSVFLKDTVTCSEPEVKSRLCNLSITSPGLYPLSYDLFNHSNVEALT